MKPYWAGLWSRDRRVVWSGLAIALSVGPFGSQLTHAQRILSQGDARRTAASKGWAIRLENQRRGAVELQWIVNGIPFYYATDNASAADSVSADELLVGGASGLSLTGAGVLLGIWDAGQVRMTHQEFGGRAVQQDAASTLHYHATHVAGTMIASGVAAAAKGMSPSASLDCYDWNSDSSEMSTAAGAGLLVSNHSYGYITGWEDGDYGKGSGWYWFGSAGISTVEDVYFGFYSAWSAEWDDIAYTYPYYLFVKSAGNDRNQGPLAGTGHWYVSPTTGNWTWSTDVRNLDGNAGYDCLAHQGTSKNGLTVGAVGDVVGGYSGSGGVVMTSFSSWGPTDDGRIKPDVVGNGSSLYSTLEGSDTSYGWLSGTSMSTPNVSGSLGLLIEHYRATHTGNDMLSATLKGLVIHSADECGSANGPDYVFGWGLVNVLKAAQIISADVAASLTISELTVQNGTSVHLLATTDGSSSELRATICWTDPAGSPPAVSLDPPDRALVNDLDLRVASVGQGVTHEPWVLDPGSPNSAAVTGDNDRDNVEQVIVYAPEGDSYRIGITHKGTLAGGSQKCSLIVTGATSVIALPVTAVDFDSDGDVDGFDFLTFASCFNGSNRPILAACPSPAADVDGDGDVDGFDFLTFSNCYNGSNRPSQCMP